MSLFWLERLVQFAILQELKGSVSACLNQQAVFNFRNILRKKHLKYIF